ncbi:microneme protein MIC5 [Toxoplasma gondii TgCatPRC2]|nr:microneme protein MIC5 [Toxoplasma gondii ME49]ESS34688.1 microneme protein MIC5 [Toxoplasma gondii VEG]KFG56886.1 microneme protein MIC5 [Toxoplasma gondii RUB]KYF40564.1 microneme protein MIC5 [Toxoplasma gondii ARI]KYK65185.1 microneme protein MIC5 [Toxoplasma gondii TgCatPRC2]PIL97375.1 microneme protein MIC5 [Toxoplasma gondii COUG]|eukprot:XP_002370455.2 microneme protein MIC5 [Toxoplasma gondii ME49]
MLRPTVRSSLLSLGLTVILYLALTGSADALASHLRSRHMEAGRRTMDTQNDVESAGRQSEPMEAADRQAEHPGAPTQSEMKEFQEEIKEGVEETKHEGDPEMTRLMVTEKQESKNFSKMAKSQSFSTRIEELGGSISFLTETGVTMIELPKTVSEHDMDQLLHDILAAGGVVGLDSEVKLA